MIGQKLQHNQITEQLGEGGMGVVYKARDTHLDRFVAIKVLPPGQVADSSRKARFAQEAKAASAMNHPNIVVVAWHDAAIRSSHGRRRGGGFLPPYTSPRATAGLSPDGSGRFRPAAA